MNFLSWNNFYSAVIRNREKRQQILIDKPELSLRWNGGVNELSIRIALAQFIKPSRRLCNLKNIDFQQVQSHGKKHLIFSCTKTHLFPLMYRFGYAIADALVLKTDDIRTTIEEVIDDFKDLLTSKQVLSLERQIGLIGELIFILQFLERGEKAIINGWRGPYPENHDFRFAEAEVEVKTTTNINRIHFIHGEHQLMASEGFDLYLYSIQLMKGSNGKSFTLDSLVEKCFKILEDDSDRRALLKKGLENCGYMCDGTRQYNQKFFLRRPSACALVSKTVPAITRYSLKSMFEQNNVRIHDVQYELNVEGLVHEQSSSEFEDIFCKLIQNL